MSFKSLRFACVLLLLTLVALPAWANNGYNTLREPVRTLVNPDQIEVVAVFSYTCPFCYQLEPLIEVWAEHLPEDVVISYMPAIFNDQWGHYARAYYIMDSLDQVDQLHLRFFRYFHEENQRPNSRRALRDFFVSEGVSAEDFDRLYDSFGVNSQYRRDQGRIAGHGLTGVPALVIDGRYVVDGQSARGLENMVRIADRLVRQVRQERRNAE